MIFSEFKNYSLYLLITFVIFKELPNYQKSQKTNCFKSAVGSSSGSFEKKYQNFGNQIKSYRYPS